MQPSRAGSDAVSVKVILLGESNVGKTSFAWSVRFQVGDKRRKVSDVMPTVGHDLVAFHAKWQRHALVAPPPPAPSMAASSAMMKSSAMSAGGDPAVHTGGGGAGGRASVASFHAEPPARIHLWDTAGQEHYQSITNQFYRNAHVVIMVYDVDKVESAMSLSRWRHEMSTKGGLLKGTPVFLIGNKTDRLDGLNQQRAAAAAAAGNVASDGPGVSTASMTSAVADEDSRAETAAAPTFGRILSAGEVPVEDTNSVLMPILTRETHPFVFSSPAVKLAMEAAEEMRCCHIVLSNKYNPQGAMDTLKFILDETYRTKGFTVKSFSTPAREVFEGASRCNPTAARSQAAAAVAGGSWVFASVASAARTVGSAAFHLAKGGASVAAAAVGAASGGSTAAAPGAGAEASGGAGNHPGKAGGGFWKNGTCYT